MTSFTFTNGGGDSLWSTNTNWNPKGVPGASDDATINLTGADVTSSSNVTVNSVTIGANSTLSISGGTFIAVSGATDSANSGIDTGSVKVEDGATFELGKDGNSESFVNNGSIALEANSHTSALKIAGTLTLGGDVSDIAVVELQAPSGGGSDVIEGDGNGSPALVLGSEIEGEGAITNLKLTLLGGSHITAAGGVLSLSTGGNAITNGGTLGAIGNGQLAIDSPVNNTGFIIAGDLSLNGTIDINAGISGGGVVAMEGNGAEIVLNSGGFVGGNVSFTIEGTGETLRITNSLSFITGDILGAAAGDHIDLGFVQFASGDHAVWQQNGSTGTLSLLSGNGTLLAPTLALMGQYTTSDFAAVSDNQNGTQINLLNKAATNDFNGDGISDMLWRDSNGTLAQWQMNGAAISSSGPPTSQGNPVAPDASWSVAAIADFNGDGDADILWRQSTGSLAMWLMNGSAISSSAPPTSQGNAVAPDSSWSVAGTGDFNADGDADILWRQNTGSLAIWLMNGSTISSSAPATSQGNVVSPDASWSVAGIGDFNGDGDSDILWRQSSTGALLDWTMSGSTIVASQNITSQGNVVAPDSSWSLVGVGDFNGDGDADMLWRQSGTNTLTMWEMHGSQIVSSLTPTIVNIQTLQSSPVSPDSTWSVVEIGDFNGDGDSDILWRQSGTGALAEWQMSGSSIDASQNVTAMGNAVTPDSTWSSQAKPTDFS